jgi:hypothetical protein
MWVETRDSVLLSVYHLDPFVPRRAGRVRCDAFESRGTPRDGVTLMGGLAGVSSRFRVCAGDSDEIGGRLVVFQEARLSRSRVWM